MTSNLLALKMKEPVNGHSSDIKVQRCSRTQQVTDRQIEWVRLFNELDAR